MAILISEDTARFIVSDAGQELLAQVGSLASDPTDQLLTLRKRGVSPDVAGPLVDVASARKRARARFPDADDLFFTGDALAQATSPGIAAYHSACLQPLKTVLEIGCGVGMDTVVFAGAGLNVIAAERDAARLVFARANADKRDVSQHIRFVPATIPDLHGARGLYVDPSRREGDRRASQNADRYDPPLALIAEWARMFDGGCVKLSPALPDDVLEAFAGSIAGRVEFLSEGRECKEACVLWGRARGAGGDLPRAAVLLPQHIVAEAGQDAPLAPSPPEAGDFALDPDSALIRAGALGAIPNAALISPDDAYLTSQTPPPPRLASAYRIEAVLPYQTRRVGEWLKAAGYGRLVVKKRHFPREPDAVSKELKMPGKGREITLILVRTGPSHLTILCQPAGKE